MSSTVRSIVGLTLAASLAMGCTGTTTSPAPTQGGQATTPAGTGAAPTVEPKTLRFANNSTLSFSLTPALVAFELLEQETGIKVEVTHFDGEDLATAALLSNNADFAVIGQQAVMAVNKGGGDLRLIFTGQGNEWILVVPKDITTTAQLDGLRLGRSGSSSNTQALLTASEQEYGYTPVYVDISGSENRVVAILADQIDAAHITYTDFEALERQAPGEYHILIKYAEEFPGIYNGDNMGGKASVLEANRPQIELAVKYLRDAYARAVAEPQWLADNATRLIPDSKPEENLAAATVLSENKIYLEDGGLSAMTPDAWTNWLNARIEAGLLTEADRMDFAQVYDPSFLEAAGN
jgi:ABC-type nitrate/sulfonate/bicarbonate transport system substrate-binding protein